MVPDDQYGGGEGGGEGGNEEEGSIFTNPLRVMDESGTAVSTTLTRRPD